MCWVVRMDQVEGESIQSATLEKPSGNLLHFAIETGPVEIVDLPMNRMVIFYSYVNVYQRVSG